jgi:tRNA-dihydrouridine synthase
MCIAGGATTTYTQMYLADRLLRDEAYRKHALLDLQYERLLVKPKERAYTIVQLGGRNIEEMVEAGKLFEGLCDGLGEWTKRRCGTF